MGRRLAAGREAEARAAAEAAEAKLDELLEAPSGSRHSLVLCHTAATCERVVHALRDACALPHSR